MLWGPELAQPNRMIHLKGWIDNMTAVSWTNKLASPNELVQQLLRVMCITLAKFSIHVSSEHIAGECNYIPDHGSRMSLSQTSLDIWLSFSLSWSRTPVPTELRHAYRCDSANISAPHWPHPRDGRTLALGPDGRVGAANPDSIRGYTHPSSNTRPISSDTRSIYTNGSDIRMALPPSSPRSALLLGIIKPPATSPLASRPNTASVSKAWPDPGFRKTAPNRPLPPCFAATTELSSLPHAETTPFGAALFSPSFSVCARASMQVLQPKPDITSGNKMSNSTTSEATLPALSRKRNRSTSSLEAARPIKQQGGKPDHSLDLAMPSSAQSSLRGACELLARRSESVRRIRSVSTQPREASSATCRSPSSPTQFAKQQDAAEPTPGFSPRTHFEAEEQPRCLWEAAPTQQSNFLDDGNRMRTNCTSESKQARTNSLLRK